MYMMTVVDLVGNAVHQVCFLMYMVAYAVHMLANTEHQVRLLMHMMSVVDLVGNVEYTQVCFPGVHDGICSTPAGKYSTPSEAPDAHDGCCRLGGKCSTPSCAPDVHDGICSNLLANTVHQVRLLIYMMSVVDLIGNASTPKCASRCT